MDLVTGGTGIVGVHVLNELLVRARELLDRCDCNGGCPACVGPILAADESVAVTPKQLAARVLDLLHTR